MTTSITNMPTSDTGIEQDADLETRRPTILCIDDDPDITHAVELALSNLDVDLTCAFNGQQGIWQCIESKPDLILTDWLMPNGSGDDLVTTLKRNQETMEIPIVVISCLGGERLKQRLRTMGVAGFVQKPITYIELLTEVARHINLPEIGSAGH